MPFNPDGTWSDDAAYTQDAFTADAVIAEQDNEGTLDALRAEQAEANSVSRAQYAGYADVIANYAARSDVEPLADRRARHQGEAITDADFTRHANYTGDNAGADAGAGHTSRLAGAGETGGGEGEGETE